MTDRILVIGAGAIGGVAAAHMTTAGHDVVVLDVDEKHVQQLCEPGLLFEELDGLPRHVRLQAVSDVGELTGTFDFALVTVKSPALEAALTPLVQRDLVDTYVSLGNGLVQDVVRSLVGDSRLIVGLVEWGATHLGAGRLRQTTRAPMVVGELDGSRTDRLARLEQVLRSITPEARQTSTIGGQVWSKLLLNSTFSGLGAAAGCLYRDVASDPVGREAALGLWAEGYDIAVALGMDLGEIYGFGPAELVVRPGDDPGRAHAVLERLMAQAGATKASMLQDLERSRKTEVDVINGGVVAAARSIERPAPLNAELTRIIHEHEEGLSRPCRQSFARLAEMLDRGVAN